MADYDAIVIGGGLVGLELAEFLAERNRRVTVLESGKQAGLPMAMPRRWTAVRKAVVHGVEIVREATVTSIDRDRVHYRTAEGDVSALGDTVVVASHVEPDTSLAESLRAAGLAVSVVGDAAEVGYIEGAIHSAGRITREL